MPGVKHFSDAERESALQIIRRYGEVSAACGNEVRLKLSRYASDTTLRAWYRESLQPKRSHHAKRPLDGSESAPLLAEVETTDIGFAKADDLTGASFVEKIEALLNRLVDRALTEEQLALISGPQVPKALGALIDQWLKLRHLDPIVLELAPRLLQFVEACTLSGTDAGQLLQDYTDWIKAKTATQAQLPAGESASATMNAHALTANGEHLSAPAEQIPEPIQEENQ